MAQDTKLVVNETRISPDEYQAVHSKSPVFYDLYDRKSDLKQQTHYCPGCGHGVAQPGPTHGVWSAAGQQAYGGVCRGGRFARLRRSDGRATSGRRL